MGKEGDDWLLVSLCSVDSTRFVRLLKAHNYVRLRRLRRVVMLLLGAMHKFHYLLTYLLTYVQSSIELLYAINHFSFFFN